MSSTCGSAGIWARRAARTTTRHSPHTFLLRDVLSRYGVGGDGWRGDGAGGAVGRRMFFAAYVHEGTLAKRCGATPLFRLCRRRFADFDGPDLGSCSPTFSEGSPRPRHTNRTFHRKGQDLSASRNCILHPWLLPSSPSPRSPSAASASPRLRRASPWASRTVRAYAPAQFAPNCGL